MALAGVVGGARAMTTDKTKNILLESAYFDPVAVRKTAKRIGVSTDASYRYERGIDPTVSDVALAAAARMIIETCGGTVCVVSSAGQIPADRVVIDYSPDMFAKKMGIDVPAETQTSILTALGYTVGEHGNKWRVFPPRRRVDVEIPELLLQILHAYTGMTKLQLRRIVARPSLCVHIWTRRWI